MEDGSLILNDSRGHIDGQLDLVALTADIVSAYVSNNRVPATEMSALLSSVHAAVAALGSPASAVDAGPEKPTPAQIRKSIRHDALISFIDGKSYKTLKRHLTKSGLTMNEYRQRYGLPRDYPSIASSYSEQRSALAKSLGLGQNHRKPVKPVEPAEKPAKTRKPKSAVAAD